MKEQVGVQVGVHLAQPRGDARRRGLERWGMAHGTADQTKKTFAVGDGLRATGIGRRGHRRSQKPHEHGELHDVAGNGRVLRGVHVAGIFGRGIHFAICGKAAGESFIGTGAFVLEEFVGDAHFDVVGFACENLEGLVLTFPSEARNHAVISIPVRNAGDSQILLLLGVGQHVGVDGFFGNVLHQAGAKGRSGNAEDDIVQFKILMEVRLFDGATAGVGAAGNDEEIVDATIGRAAEGTVRIQEKFEASFADGTVRSNKGWKIVLCAIQTENQGLRIRPDKGEDCRAGA